MNTSLVVVTHVPWKSERMCRAVSTPPDIGTLPGRLGAMPDMRRLQDIIGHYWYVLLQGPSPDDPSKLRNALDAAVPLRHTVDVRLHEQESSIVKPYTIALQRRTNAAHTNPDVHSAAQAPGFRGGRHRRVNTQPTVTDL